MNDKQFLQWIHDKLEAAGDSAMLDCMHKLRAIIAATDENKLTPNVCSSCDGRPITSN